MSSLLGFRAAFFAFPAAWLALASFGAAAAIGACNAEAPLDTSGSGGDGASAPTCISASAPCDVLFTFPFHNEQTVELRGDFGGATTWVTGVRMQLDGNEWRASVAVANDTTIDYKFYVNGSQWVTDPMNQSQDKDGNSVTVASCKTCPSGAGGAN